MIILNNIYNYTFRSGIGTIFALPWLISWFSHSLDQHSKVVRLFDFFLASPKEIILYVIAQLINARRDEVLSTECDMACVHMVLSKVLNKLHFSCTYLINTFLYNRFQKA